MTIYQYPPAPTFTTAIKSIQTGTISLAAVASNTDTITSVDTTKAVCYYNGSRAVTGVTAFIDALATVVLTNATTVTAQRSGNSGNLLVAYTVVEYL